MRVIQIFNAEFKKYCIEIKAYYPDHIVNIVVLMIFFVGFLNSNIGSGDYNTVYIGFVFWFFASNIITESSSSISFEKQVGTFEQLLSKPVNIQLIIICRVVSWLLVTFMKVAFVLLCAKIVFNIPFIMNAEIVGILLLTLIGVLGVGLFLSALTIKYTKTASFESIINYFLLFFSGTFGFAEKTNSILRVIQENIPLSKGIELAKESFSGTILWNDYLFLTINSTVYFLIGLITFELILLQGRKNGISSNY